MIRVLALALLATAGFAAGPLFQQHTKGTTTILGGGCTKTATLKPGESASFLLWKYFRGSKILARDINDGKSIEWIAAQKPGYVFCVAEFAD